MLEGKYDQAEPLLVEALEKRRRVLGQDHPDTLVSINDLGLLRENQGRLDECERLYREALDGYRRVLGPDHPSTLTAMNNMGALLIKRGRAADAEPFCREAAERSRRSAGANHPRTLIFVAGLGTTLARQNKFADAEAQLLEAATGIAANPSLPPAYLRRCAQELVRLYTAWDKAEPGKGYDLKARQWQSKLPSTQPATTQSTTK
jgi:Flp pilus assembly protein TadD